MLQRTLRSRQRIAARQPDTLADWQCVVNMCLQVLLLRRKPLPFRLTFYGFRGVRVLHACISLDLNSRTYTKVGSLLPSIFPSIHAEAAEVVFNLNFAPRSLSVINLSACQALDAVATRLQVCGACRSGVVRLLLRGRRDRRPYNARICPIMIQAGRAERRFRQCGTINFADGGAFGKIVPPQINPLGSRVERGRNGSDYIGGNYSLGGSVLSAQGGERAQWIDW